MRFLLILLVLSTYSCSKTKLTNTDCTDSNTLFMPDVPKSFFAFKPGTWWVYEDLINHTFDSVWVGENTSVKQTMTTDDGNSSRCVEINTTRLYNKKYNIQAIDPKYRTSYVDITIRPLYVTQLSSTFSVNSVSDVSVNLYEQYPVGKFNFARNIFTDAIKTDNGYAGIDSNYLLNDRTIGIAIIDSGITVPHKRVVVKKIGLYQWRSPNDHVNMILRRYNIVQ